MKFINEKTSSECCSSDERNLSVSNPTSMKSVLGISPMDIFDMIADSQSPASQGASSTHEDEASDSPDMNMKNKASQGDSPTRNAHASTTSGSHRLFSIKSGNEWMLEAVNRPDPIPLWDSMWYEGELSCLFADSNLGKSIYAVQIAQKVALTRPIIYFDFELSDKQFQLRYTDEQGRLHQFPENMIRAEIDTQLLTMEIEDIESRIIEQIEYACVERSVDTIIIDNLSYLCNSADKSDMAGRLMLKLLDLKKRRNFSILVLAHTPKRSLTSPITQNDLAGSKKLFNFFDSVFAIGRSAKDEELRYIKQLKVRAGKFEYDSENVIISEIVKEGTDLHFETIGFGCERDHLRENRDNEVNELAETVRSLAAQGLSYNAIAQRLGVSKSKAYRLATRA